MSSDTGLEIYDSLAIRYYQLPQEPQVTFIASNISCLCVKLLGNKMGNMRCVNDIGSVQVLINLGIGKCKNRTSNTLLPSVDRLIAFYKVFVSPYSFGILW